MGDGSIKNIGDLEGLTNFEVLSYNEANEKFEIAKAKSCTKKSDDSKIVRVTLDNGTHIDCTPDHLFLTKHDGWVQAKDLKENQSLRALYGYVKDTRLFQSNEHGNTQERDWLRIRKHSDSEKYYVYLYLDPRKPGVYKYGDLTVNFEPIYVGKGIRNRCLQHLKNREKENSYFYKKLNKIISEGYDPIVIKQAVGLTETAALRLEEQLINQIGVHFDKTGPLTNNTYGGEGTSRLVQSQKVLDRMKNNNPMSNKNVAEQQVKTSLERGNYKKISDYMKSNNPMKSKAVIEKVTKTNNEHGLYSSENMKKKSHARTKETFKQIIKSREANNPDCYKNFYEGGKAWRKNAIANGTYHTFSEDFRRLAGEQSRARWETRK